MSRLDHLISRRWERYLWLELRRDERSIARYRSRIRQLQEYRTPDLALVACYERLIRSAMLGIDRRRAALGLDRGMP